MILWFTSTYFIENASKSQVKLAMNFIARDPYLEEHRNELHNFKPALNGNWNNRMNVLLERSATRQIENCILVKAPTYEWYAYYLGIPTVITGHFNINHCIQPTLATLHVQRQTYYRPLFTYNRPPLNSIRNQPKPKSQVASRRLQIQIHILTDKLTHKQIRFQKLIHPSENNLQLD